MNGQPYPGHGAPGPAQRPPGPAQGYPGPQGPAWSGHPPGPPKPKRTGRVVAIVVVAVLVVAGAAGGVWYFQSAGGSGDSGLAAEADQQLELLVEEMYPEDWKPVGYDVQMTVGAFLDGHWWTEGHLVREMPEEVVAYDLADGSIAWRAPVPGNGNCRASREQTADGFVVLLGGDEMDVCTRITVIDVTTGTALWSKDLPPLPGGAGQGDQFPNAGHVPVIVGDNVYVSTKRGGQFFSVVDGSQPQPYAPSSCFATDFLGFGDTLLSWRDCLGSDEQNLPGRHLAAFDRDQKPLWRWMFPEDRTELQLNGVLSVDPLVVVVKSERGASELWQVEPGSDAPDNPGKHSVLVPQSEMAEYMSPCKGEVQQSLDDCSRAFVGDGVLYLQSTLDPNFRRKGMVALDLTTGEELWHARPGEELSLAPMGVDENGRLVGLQFQTEDQRGVVVSADPASGSLTPLAGLPPRDTVASDGARGMVENNDLDDELAWHDGHLAILSLTPEVSTAAGSPATVIFR